VIVILTWINAVCVKINFRRIATPTISCHDETGQTEQTGYTMPKYSSKTGNVNG